MTLVPEFAATAYPVASMTGFARLTVDIPEIGTATLSIKTVNHRFLDLQLRVPFGLDALEMELRRILKENILRGHVEFALSIDRVAETHATYNRTLVSAYLHAFRSAAREFHLAGEPDLNLILRAPGVLQAETRSNAADEERISSAVIAAMATLLDSLSATRRREGQALARILDSTLATLLDAVNAIAVLRPEVEARFEQRLAQRLDAALLAVGNPAAKMNTVSRNQEETVPHERILAEIALLVERSDVSEEVARMVTHVEHFRDTLARGGEVGKKLDFLLQEMNREANTLLSKTSGIAGKGTEITKLGLVMKAEIEKAREQVQNIE